MTFPRKTLASAATLAALALTSMPHAVAGPPANSWYVAPEVIYLWTDRDRLSDDGFGGTLAFGRSFEKWDAELALTYAPLDADGGADLNYASYFANFHRVFYRDSRISPYLKLGVGWVDPHYTYGSALASTSVSDWTLAYGAGLLTTLSRNESRGSSLSLRTEIYGLITSGTHAPNGDHLSDTVAGIGLQYNWGAPVASAVLAAPPPPPPPPVLDSDGDGVPDNIDQCPNTPAGAPVDARGCEFDADRDGVVDSQDQCPDTPIGVKVDKIGCPYDIELKVLFDNNSSVIRPESFGLLGQVAGVLKNNPNIRGVIEGHTDSNGSEAFNQRLSEARANSVRDWFVGEGIEGSRLTAVGFGESRPVADNATPEGRALNRRVVLVRSDRPQ